MRLRFPGVTWMDTGAHSGSEALVGVCSAQLRAHTYTHVHTPKTPVMNKDAHRNLLPQSTYSPQTSSSGPNPHPISMLRLVHTDGCVLSHSTHSHTQMLTLRFTPSHACAHRPSPTKEEGRQIRSSRAPLLPRSPPPCSVPRTEEPLGAHQAPTVVSANALGKHQPKWGMDA